eukprot:3929006-Ditylum_brightwellii.AAC.1
MHIRSQADSNSITETYEQLRELQESAEVPIECKQNKPEPRAEMIKMIKPEPAPTNKPKDTKYLRTRYKKDELKKGLKKSTDETNELNKSVKARKEKTEKSEKHYEKMCEESMINSEKQVSAIKKSNKYLGK